MTSIEALQKKYPNIPQEVVVKWEVLSRGIRDTEDLNKTAAWMRRDNWGTYQSYDQDVTLEEVVGKKSNRVKPGYMLRSTKFYMGNGVGSDIQLNTKSPYEIRDLGDGRFGLFEGDEKVDVDIYFPLKPEREEGVTSKGTAVGDLVPVNRRCFGIIPVRYCEYFATGDQCKFCNFNPAQIDARTIGLDRAVTINLEETVEAYKIQSAEVRLIEGRLEMGGFMNSEIEGRIYFDLVGKLANAAPYKPNIKVITQAMSRKDMLRLKDAGLDTLSLQLEVWDPGLFSKIVPGKSKHCTREQWLEAYLDAVDIFEAGNVGGKIIGGLTMIPEDGHKTWQEARDSHIEGNTWMIKNGVFPIFTNLRLPPGSVYGEDSSNRLKLPPTEYYLEVAQAHHEAMKEYGLYEKLNKFLYCGLCCTTHTYCGEIGMLEIAGDVGSWMADVVPAESNWMAKFVQSIQPSLTENTNVRLTS